MPRIARIAHEDVPFASPAAREIIHFAEHEGGPDPRMVGIFARSEVGIAFMQCWRTTLFGGLLPHRMKELVRMHMSLLESCGYCSSIRTTQGKLEGIDNEVLLAMDDYATSPLFDEREKAALTFADAYKAQAADDDAVFEALGEHFSEEEMIELGVLCMLLDGGSQWARAMQVVTWDQACAIDPVAAARATAGVPA